MKVLFVINGLGTGGAERSLAELLPLIEAAGVDPVVVCLYRRREGVESAILRDGFDVRYLPGKRSSSRVRQLREILGQSRPDLVHTAVIESSLIGRVAAMGQRTVVLSSLVGMPYTPERFREDPLVRPSKLRLVRAADTWTARHLTTHFHAITEAVKQWAIDAMGIRRDRITVIERGRDPARLGRPSPARRAAARAKLGLRDDHEVVVTVGRHEFAKGQRYLLEAAESVAARRPNAIFLIAGRDGNATPTLSELASRTAIGGSVRLLGHREDVPEILAAADLFVFPSLYEGQGGAVLEAMALGLPMVLSDIPALREISDPGRTSVLVEPASPPALVAAISDLLEDSSRRRTMGSLSRERFEDRFTLDRSARRMLDLYERLTEGRKPRRTESSVATP